MTFAISNDFLQAYSDVPRGHQKKVREFIERFQQRPDAPGLNYEAIESARDKRLFSARIDQAYRAVIFHPSGSDVYVLAWVANHDDAYNWASSKTFQVNPATGALQVVNSQHTEEAAAPKASAAADGGLFRNVKDKHLLRLGVPELLLPLVRSLETDGDLERAESELPQEAYEALFLLASGYSVDEVFREIEKPEEAPAPVDTGDFATALKQEDSQRRFFIPDDTNELSEVLNAPLEQWRIFLHPKQRKLVQMNANGPVRVLGGAGTGKTVAAMHRARYLAEKVFPLKEDRILLTTFTRNLATDIADNLRKLCTPETYARIEVVNLDHWVENFLRTQGYRHRVIFNAEGNDSWQNALQSAPDLGLPRGFYRAEWEDVIQAQNITSAEQYMKAARLGRGTRLSREKKKQVWAVFQEYRTQMNEKGSKEFVDLIRDARSLIETKQLKMPYRAVVVDEAQDMSAEAFRLLRALVPPGPNDLFIVGDAHQRIYRYRVTLGKCGVDIRGRGKTLKLNYRTTEQIRRFAVALLEGREIDNLDGGRDTQKGYHSSRNGPAPVAKVFPTFAKEAAYIESQIRAFQEAGESLNSICVVGRTHNILELYDGYLRDRGFDVHEIRRTASDRREKPGVRLATMHRVKGLEFDHVFVVSANQGILPLEQAMAGTEDAVAERNAELVERSLLYVALTRAKKTATVTAWGAASPLLKLGNHF